MHIGRWYVHSAWQ